VQRPDGDQSDDDGGDGRAREDERGTDPAWPLIGLGTCEIVERIGHRDSLPTRRPDRNH
jgi:hypothetical protein